MVEIRGAIADSPDLVVIRNLGNFGDQLILEGTRQLLSDRRYREITLDELGRAEGDVGLLVGGGAFSRAYHEWAPWALRIAEARFERVIVLPSTFELEVPLVRETLAGTSAIVFARELDSYQALRDLCDARLALDGAFYFDFDAHRRDGTGVLNAFRTDREAPDDWPPPPENRDISLTAGSLEAWLETIARHALVRTNRAHVMIAAAMLGKQVELGPCRSRKLRALAEFALADFPIGAVTAPTQDRRPARNAGGGRPRSPRVTVIVENGGLASPSSDPQLSVDTEYVLFMEPGAEPRPGALEDLIAALDRDPGAVAAAPALHCHDGSLIQCGGEVREWNRMVEFRPGTQARRCDWAPLHVALVRSETLEGHPFDRQLPPEFRAREWGYRIATHHGPAIHACPDAAVVLHHALAPAPDTTSFRGRCLALPDLVAMAIFYRRHGALMWLELRSLFPTIEPDSARLLMAVLDGLGPDRFLGLWSAGELDSLIEDNRAQTEAELERVSRRMAAVEASRMWRLARAYYKSRAFVGKLTAPVRSR